MIIQRLISVKRWLFLSTLIFVSTLFVIFQYAVVSNTRNIIESWLQSESNNLKEGLLLPVLTKAERLVNNSDQLQGFVVLDLSGNSERPRQLIRVGQSFDFEFDSKAIGHGAIMTSTTGLFSFVIAYPLPNLKLIVFKSKPTFWVPLIIVIGTLLLIYILIMWLLIRVEASRRFNLFKIALESLSNLSGNVDFLRKESPGFTRVWEEANLLLKRQSDELARVSGEMSRAEIAKQVAHDIRSPLSALNIIIGSIGEVPEARRIIIRNAVNRINDIANELLQKSKDSTMRAGIVVNDVPDSEGSVDCQLLSPLIDSIVSEKRIQYRELKDVVIEVDLSHGYGLFAQISESELKRVISNLVNNSIEAFSDRSGKIVIALRNYNRYVNIIIQDNGQGMPVEILKSLGEKGVSFGKANSQSGSGMGVYHAKKAIESAGGKFEVQSREGVGTVISMSLIKINPPDWFVEKLMFFSNMQVVTLDDDLSIHQLWQRRFEELGVSDNGILHRQFTSISEFKIWFESQNIEVVKKLKNILVLIDYEFLNQESNGLDLVEAFGISEIAILVTSRFDERQLRTRCQKLGLKLIPKPMAGIVPNDIRM